MGDEVKCENCGADMAIGQTITNVLLDDGSFIDVLITVTVCNECEDLLIDCEEAQG